MIRIQDTEDPNKYVDVFKNALPMFIQILKIEFICLRKFLNIWT